MEEEGLWGEDAEVWARRAGSRKRVFLLRDVCWFLGAIHTPFLVERQEG